MKQRSVSSEKSMNSGKDEDSGKKVDSGGKVDSEKKVNSGGNMESGSNMNSRKNRNSMNNRESRKWTSLELLEFSMEHKKDSSKVSRGISKAVLFIARKQADVTEWWLDKKIKLFPPKETEEELVARLMKMIDEKTIDS